MNTKERKELAAILGDMAAQLKKLDGIPAQLKNIAANQKVLMASNDAYDEQFKKINRSLGNLALVSEETQRSVEQVRTNMMSSIDKLGKRTKVLELVKNSGDDGGGRRLARKNS